MAEWAVAVADWAVGSVEGVSEVTAEVMAAVATAAVKAAVAANLVVVVMVE